MPESDVADFGAGASHIPHKVTEARRRGEVVKFVRHGDTKDWYWEMRDGAKILHG